MVDGVDMVVVDGVGGVSAARLMTSRQSTKEVLNPGEEADGVGTEEVAGEVGDVGVDPQMLSKLMRLKLDSPREVLNHGDTVDGEVGDVSVAP